MEQYYRKNTCTFLTCGGYTLSYWKTDDQSYPTILHQKIRL